MNVAPQTQTVINFKLEEKRAQYPAKSLSREAPEWDRIGLDSETYSSALCALLSLPLCCHISIKRKEISMYSKRPHLPLVFALALLLMSLLADKEADAQNFWQQATGPSSAWALAINSNGHIFAGGDIGIYRSTNNGDKWTAVNSSLKVNALVFNASGHIFAGTVDGGVFLSTDNGDSWTAVNNGLLNPYVNALTINSSGHIFAGTNGRGVYRTTDNGANWTAVNSGLPTFVYIYALAVNSRGHIFAGTDKGVYRSMDNGDSWTAVNGSLTPYFILTREYPDACVGDESVMFFVFQDTARLAARVVHSCYCHQL